MTLPVFFGQGQNKVIKRAGKVATRSLRGHKLSGKGRNKVITRSWDLMVTCNDLAARVTNTYILQERAVSGLGFRGF